LGYFGKAAFTARAEIVLKYQSRRGLEVRRRLGLIEVQIPSGTPSFEALAADSPPTVSGSQFFERLSSPIFLVNAP
jgi:hypothetical protein